MALDRWTLRRVVAVLAVACATAWAVPAAAVAGNQQGWQRVGGTAPGGDDLAVIDGVPHVAWTDADGVHVARLDTAPGPWHAVGLPFRHAPGSSGVVRDASLASDPAGKPWVVWTEEDGGGTRQVRVARFDGTAWHEVVGGPHPLNPVPYPGYENVANSGFDPQLVFYGGVPYVAWLQDEPGEFQAYVSRLKPDGSAWERIPMQADARGPVRIAVSGGRVFVAWRNFPMAAPEIRRLNMAGTGWESVGYPPDVDYGGRFGDIADVQGVFHVLYRTATNDPPEVRVVRLLPDPDGSYEQVGAGLAHGEGALLDNSSLEADGAVLYAARVTEGKGIDVQRYANGAWEPLPPPAADGGETDSVELAAGPSGGMWILYSRISGGVTTWRVAGIGVTLPEPEPPPDDGNPNPGGEPEPPATGHCANTVRGTSRSDVLRGTVRSDSILGYAGRDRLFGYRGNDCLFGGAGADFLNGGRGADLFVGGSGADVLLGRDGNDDMNGNSGNDRIFPGRGRDAVSAGSGNDRVDVRGGGFDLVNCGSGRDTVLVDRRDRTKGCERIVVRR